ncbi:glycosyltransferase family 4 protein [Tardiphaga sp.]|uniref:glycosyltransferase family 4 protein n=1 Tax=Tardiphaga sp. TaxID=1926292 RepID=UPI0037DA4F82
MVPLEDDSSLALLPIVKLVAGATRAKRIEIVHPDLLVTKISRLSTVVDFILFVGASMRLALHAIMSTNELKTLLKAPRLALRSPKNNQRVLYLKTNLWMGIKAGGSIGHIAGVVNGLQDAGYPVTLASAEQPVMVDSKVKLQHVNPPRTFGLPYELNNYRFQDIFAKTVRPLLAGHAHGVIYQRLSAANYLGALLSREYQLPLIVEYNGSETWVAKNWGRQMRFHGLATMAEEAMLRHAHLIVTISNVLRDELISRGVEPKRIVTYPNCIDPAIFDPACFSLAERNKLRARYGITSKERLIAFIGTFGQWHGVDVLARAIAQMCSDDREWINRHNCRFMLVGDGLKMNEVRRTICDAGAEDICIMTGLVPQTEAALHLAAADLFLSPHVANTDGSKFFGSPTKLFEYMAMSRGIYGSRLDQIGEVLSPSLDVNNLPALGASPQETNVETAVLGAPGSVDDLIAGIRFLVERPEWAEHIAANARNKALSKYTWQRHVDAILDGYKAIMREPE